MGSASCNIRNCGASNPSAAAVTGGRTLKGAGKNPAAAVAAVATCICIRSKSRDCCDDVIGGKGGIGGSDDGCVSKEGAVVVAAPGRSVFIGENAEQWCANEVLIDCCCCFKHDCNCGGSKEYNRSLSRNDDGKHACENGTLCNVAWVLLVVVVVRRVDDIVVVLTAVARWEFCRNWLCSWAAVKYAACSATGSNNGLIAIEVEVDVGTLFVSISSTL